MVRGSGDYGSVFLPQRMIFYCCLYTSFITAAWISHFVPGTGGKMMNILRASVSVYLGIALSSKVTNDACEGP